MKNYKIILVILIIQSQILSAQFLINGDFEIWNPIPNVSNGAEDPYYWTSTNIVYTDDSIPKISKSTDAYDGNFALRIDMRAEKISSQRTNVAVGYGIHNKLTFNGLFEASDTISFFPQKMVGYYKRIQDTPSPFKDSLEIWVGFLKEIEILGIPHGLGHTVAGLPNTPHYQYFEIPLVIPGNKIDSVNISIGFATTDTTGSSNSYALFDNLDLIPRTVSTSQSMSTRIKVFPNPTTDYLYIENDSDISIDKIALFNSNGQVVKEWYNETQLNVQDLSSGTYFIQLATSDGLAVDKVVIE